MTAAQEERWILSHLESPDALVICCEVDGVLIGTCNLNFNSKKKMAHRARIGITIRKAYWNLGIGSAMFREMIAAAEARDCAILELEFIEGNDRGRALYEKFGFTIVACRPNAFRLKDGRMLNEYLMQKELKKK